MEVNERTPRLTHPDLDFWVDVRMRPCETGTWIATADLGDDHDVGMDQDPRKAVEKALGALGERYAREMAIGAESHKGGLGHD